jgi:hypothetical protein
VVVAVVVAGHWQCSGSGRMQPSCNH